MACWIIGMLGVFTGATFGAWQWRSSLSGARADNETVLSIMLIVATTIL